MPFWLSAVVVLIAWYIRRSLEEPPVFKETVEEIEEREGVDNATAKLAKANPVREVLRDHWVSVLRIAFAAMINTVNVVVTVWSLSYATSIVGLDRSTMLWVTVLGNLCALIMIPLSARAADRFGRKVVFIIGALGAAVMMYPYLTAVNNGNWTLIFLFGVIMFGMFYQMANAVWPALYSEMFPTSVRVTGVALGTQIGFAVSGGFAPVLASLVAGADGDNYLGVALFTSVVALFSAAWIFTARETSSLTLAQIDATSGHRNPGYRTEATATAESTATATDS